MQTLCRNSKLRLLRFFISLLVFIAGTDISDSLFVLNGFNVRLARKIADENDTYVGSHTIGAHDLFEIILESRQFSCLTSIVNMPVNVVEAFARFTCAGQSAYAISCMKSMLLDLLG